VRTAKRAYNGRIERTDARHSCGGPLSSPSPPAPSRLRTCWTYCQIIAIRSSRAGRGETALSAASGRDTTVQPQRRSTQ
jgi:hypothetical protein